MNRTLSRCYKGLLLAVATILCLTFPARQSAAAVVSATVFVGLTQSFSDLDAIQFTLLNDSGADHSLVQFKPINETLASTFFIVGTTTPNKSIVAWGSISGISTGANPLFQFNFPLFSGYPRFTIDPSSKIVLTNSTGALLGSSVTNFVVKTAYLTDLGVTQYFLNSTHAGIGGGTVTSDLTGIACTSSCSAIYDTATTVTLLPTVRSDSYFAGWSGGGCSGVGNCQVTLNDETTVTATFDIHPPVTLGDTQNYHLLIGNAYALALDGIDNIIKIRAVDLGESPVFNSPKNVTLNGGLDGTFSSAIGYTTLHGMTVATGTVTVDKIIIM